MAALTLDRETREDYRMAAAWLLRYHDRKKYCEQQREAILQSSAKPADGMPRSTEPRDPTGGKAQRLADLQLDEAWISLVEDLERSLPPRMQVFLQLRREAERDITKAPGRRGWVRYVQKCYPKEMAKITGRREANYWVERRTLFTWWDRIITYTVIKASKRGLLK